MPKCSPKRRHRFVFEKPAEVTDAYQSGGNKWLPPARTVKRSGYLKTRIPTELEQAGQMQGALGYEIEIRYDPEAAAITAEWRVKIVTMSNKIIYLRGPAANRDGLNRYLDFVAIEQTS